MVVSMSSMFCNLFFHALLLLAWSNVGIFNGYGAMSVHLQLTRLVQVGRDYGFKVAASGVRDWNGMPH